MFVDSRILCKLIRVFFFVFSISLFASTARAQNGSWNIDASGNWTGAGNWTGGIIPGAGGTATFGQGFGYSANRTVTIDAATANLAGLTFDTPLIYTVAGTNAVNIDPSGFTINALQSNGATPTSFGVGHIISAPIAGTSTSFNKTGSGFVSLTGTNTFIAPISISGGLLRTTVGDVALGNAANSLTINGGSMRASTTALVMNRNVTIGAAGATFENFVNTSIGTGGSLSGTGQLTSRISGGFAISGNGSAFTGAVQHESGTFTLNNAGTVGGTSSFDLAGTLLMDNTATNLTDRFNNGRAIISRGANISLTGHADGSTESIGNLVLRSGNSIVTNTSAAGTSTLTLSGLTRENRSTVLFRGTNLGSASAPVGNIEFTASPGTLIGGGGSPTASTQASILAFAYGSNSPTATSGTSLSFATWDSGSNRILLLDTAAGYVSGFATATANDNVNILAAATVNAGGQTINSLRTGAFTITGGASDVLTLNSGAILSTGVATLNAPVNFATGVEGVIHAASQITFNGVISGDNGLTKSGTSIISLNANNTYSGVTTLVSGTTRIGVDVQSGVNGALGNSTSAIQMTGGSTTATTQLVAQLGTRTVGRDINILTGGTQNVGLGRTTTGDSLVVNGNINITNQNGSTTNGFVSLNGGTVIGEAVVLNGIVSGNGGLTSTSTTTAITSVISVLNGNNDYTGGTNMQGGTFLAGHNNAFGSGLIWGSGEFSTISSNGGARTFANNLHLQNNIVFGGSDAMTFGGNVFLAGGTRVLTVDTSSPNGVSLSGVVSGGGVIKSGAGVLQMSNAANTYSGSTTVRNGRLVLGGNALVGSGVLGSNPNTALASAGTIALADATSVATDNITLVSSGAFTNARKIQVNANNSTGTTTIGGTNTSGTAAYSGQINLGRAATAFTTSAGGRVRYDGQFTETLVASANFVGVGVHELTAGNLYTGGSSVTGGTLLANNVAGSATGTGNLVVNSGATLGGAGFISPGGANIVTISGTVAPGNSAGTLTFGSVATPTTVNLSGIYAFELATAGTGSVALNSGLSSPLSAHTAHDVLSVFGTLNLTGSTVNISAFGGTGFNSGLNYSWLIGTSNGGTLTSAPTIGLVGGGDFTGLASSAFTVGNTGGNLYLNYISAIPEPGSMMVLGLGLLMLSGRRRTKNC